MIVRRRMLSAAVVGVVVAAGLIAVPVSAVTAAETAYKACANKKTGEMRLVVKGKKCKKNEKKLKWNVTGPIGPQGAVGPAGAQGTTGARGPAGGYQFRDQTGAVVGDALGYYSGVFPMVRLASGAVVAWDNTAANPSPLFPTAGATLFYKEAGCQGAAYAVYSSLPFDVAVSTAAPVVAGSPLYRLVPGTPQAFTAGSNLTSSGCSAGGGAVSDAYEVTSAGTLPSVVKPLYLAPIT